MPKGNLEILKTGQEESLEKINLVGFVIVALLLLRVTSSATTASKYMLTLETMQRVMAKNGFNASIVPNGFISNVRPNMVFLISRKRMIISSISVLLVERRN